MQNPTTQATTRKPYYDHGGQRTPLGQFAPGHQQVKTAQHRANIAAALREAWRTKRKRMPLGSRWIDASGYVRVKVADEGQVRWRLEHVLVVESVVGRAVARGEIVHHINGDRQDNRPENLYLCRDMAHHNEIHRSQDVALRSLLAAGVVVFRDGVYEAVLPR